MGVPGVITGKAIYEGKINLKKIEEILILTMFIIFNIAYLGYILIFNQIRLYLNQWKMKIQIAVITGDIVNSSVLKEDQKKKFRKDSIERCTGKMFF